ncbi:bifunctional riboflavin kinase/FAD synthetase [Gilvimarinus sp. F26214L]|uniref:bifunctional riboflavin kinase/FAD synthetase n=1 Tax=Gilvimarinus sp. DZF01 TaxID=3461371 RepID=UPI0040457450
MSDPSQCETRKDLIRGRANLQPEHRGNVVTIGAFDGVHLGHQAIIGQVRNKARALNLPSTAIIFEPLPREYFQQGVARIQPFRDKVETLFAEGIDRVLCLHFNRQLAAITPRDFIHSVLVEGLGTRHLVVGDDFRFGNKRAGGAALLRAEAQVHGFGVESAATVELDGERVSSSRIRASLAAGRFAEAGRLLGRPFSISGRVKTGKQLGRQLGVRTANVCMRRDHSPLSGVFAVTVSGAGLDSHPGVANIGVRPTVNAVKKPLLEVHLLEFSGDLYGQRIRVEPKLKLREEERFKDLQALREQMEKDIRNARDYFSL